MMMSMIETDKQHNVGISPGSVTDTDTEYRGISKYRYRYRSRYSKYRKIPNTEEKNTEKFGKSVFQFCKYNPSSLNIPCRNIPALQFTQVLI